jgi:hypothetical protein
MNKKLEQRIATDYTFRNLLVGEHAGKADQMSVASEYEQNIVFKRAKEFFPESESNDQTHADCRAFIEHELGLHPEYNIR